MVLTSAVTLALRLPAFLHNEDSGSSHFLKGELCGQQKSQESYTREGLFQTLVKVFR